ncbi:MAG: hypothetical protein ACJ718_00940, partial [Nitrososphaeraceae archaeon]
TIYVPIYLCNGSEGSGFLKVPRYDRISSLDMSLNDFLYAKNLDSVKRSLIISFLEVSEILDSLLAAIM